MFEAWFLLVQCACWVEVAAELLVSAGAEDREALLWLLMFYHHPTSRGHRRTLQLVGAGGGLCPCQNPTLTEFPNFSVSTDPQLNYDFLGGGPGSGRVTWGPKKNENDVWVYVRVQASRLG